MLTVEKRVFTQFDTLTPAEKKVSRALMADYPSAGLGPSTELARRAGTSIPTVLRFLAKLGFENYSDFQGSLRAEITVRKDSPVNRAEEATLDESTLFGGLAHIVKERSVRIESLLSTVPLSEFDDAVRRIVEARKIVITGGFFSLQVARLFVQELSQLRDHVTLLTEPLGRDAGYLADMRKGSCAIIFDMRRYEKAAETFSKKIKSMDADLIVITDVHLSPSAALADCVLPISVDEVPFDSFVPVLALVEALVAQVFSRNKTLSLRRMRLWESLVDIERAGIDSPQ